MARTYLVKRFSLPLIAILLSGCILTEVTYQPFAEEIAPFVQEGGDFGHYYRPDAYGESYTDVIRSHPNPAQRMVPMETTGTQKVLVIPVAFADYPAETLGVGPEVSRTIIENAFFGTSQTTQWESVSSFYHASSYGQLLIQGAVSAWYSSPETVFDLAQSGSKTVATERILKAAVNWYKATYDDVAAFDQNGDGAIDAVFLVYAAPYIDNDSVFWAFTSFDTGVNYEEHVGDPLANAYVWASYHFLNVYRSKGDPHTFIHEFGHLLGLSDYYNTSSIPSVFPSIAAGATPFERYQYTHGPTGKIDMMDYSIGDHTSLSKMLLGWTRPYVVNGPGTVTIKPFVATGDVIIVSPDWNGNPHDEYLAIEFYAPSGLNYIDSARAYGHPSASLMGNHGIKVYHVDARVSYNRTAGDAFLGYVDDTPIGELPPDVVAENGYYRRLAHTNTYGTTTNGHLLYRLLEKGETDNLLLGRMATDAALYGAGDSFGITDYQTFSFNDGSGLTLRFTVSALDRYQATLTFSV